jgi:phage FluMu protein Com
MAKCPKCGEEIAYLNMFEVVEERAKFELDPQGDPQKLVEANDYVEGEDPDFECPRCDECLFHDWDEATEFLKDNNE